MKVIHAHWDDISLGIKSFEISLSERDDLQEFFREENRLILEEKAGYISVKTPVGIQKFLFGLAEAGYIFLETGVELLLKKKSYISPVQFKKFDREIETVSLNSEDDIQRVYSEIRKGIFEVDRISIDKNFSQQLGNQRCVNWINSLVESGNLIQEVRVKGVPTGFFILQPQDDKRIRGILTGIYQQSAGSGVLVMKQLKEFIWQRGYEVYSAHVSSNNVRALRANLFFGSEIERLSYTYVKHIKKGEPSNGGI